MHCGQIPYIISIVEKEGLTQEELSTTVHLDRGHTARMLKTMEASGLIKREKNPENRRQKFVYPTTKGKARYQALMPVLSRHNAVMFRGFSAEERNAAITILDRVIANVQSELDGERI
ncbi:hypothetical protein PSDVSF_32890 [Pseudodesulfovibrio sediminis]|uniref:HTH marR-type domain-containing protein n=2 Tax=Pseudodesulfovibrio sediminis TaxID=2810563 RepID=A0ABM7PAE5_9BACT|nr:hypothetical protein PSDVSF_32890 [Pseudodesulfovibrio sediminis]